MKEPIPILPRLRCPKCRNTKPQRLSITTEAYWVYPEWRVRGSAIEIFAASGEVNMNSRMGIIYYLMCRRATCGAITLLPANYRVTLI